MGLPGRRKHRLRFQARRPKPRKHSEESMSSPPNSSKPAPNTLSNEEARMRQALGLHEGAPNPRPPQRREQDHGGRRFVKDGEVPVVMLSASRDRGGDVAAPVNRVAAAEAALKTERAARERAERSLQEALAAVQHLQTQLAHAELAHKEALAAERHGREAAEQVLAAANAAREATAPRSTETTARASPGKPRRKTGGPVQREPQPVKWWLPSYRAKMRKD